MCPEVLKRIGTFLCKGTNTAERSLRPAVIYRKLSFGTQSARGSRLIERILTVSETCRMHGRSVFEFMVDAVTAHFANQTSPTLLPKSAKSEAASRVASFSFCSHRLVNAYRVRRYAFRRLSLNPTLFSSFSPRSVFPAWRPHPRRASQVLLSCRWPESCHRSR